MTALLWAFCVLPKHASGCSLEEAGIEPLTQGFADNCTYPLKKTSVHFMHNVKMNNVFFVVNKNCSSCLCRLESGNQVSKTDQ